MHRSLLPLFLVIVACGKDEPEDTGSVEADDTAPPTGIDETWYRDADGDGFGDDGDTLAAQDQPDGYVLDGGDCDDADPQVHPGAEELCNGADDDCDGLADEGALVDWYLDSDGDGWGDDASWTESCVSPGSGWVLQGGDCDEGDPAVNPGATEACDGDDDDCDGRPDQGAVSTWYSDDDGDGWGDPDSAAETCDPEPGWVQQAGDCDPADGAVFPDATEQCNELDDDCDGETDEGFDLDGDGYQDASCAHLDFGDCDDGDPAIHPQSPEICDDGIDQDCDGYDSFCSYDGGYFLSAAHAWRWSTDATGDAGRLVHSADFDQDGYDDLLTASLYVSGNLGGAWVSYGPLFDDKPFSDDSAFLAGTRDARGAGRSLGAGDVNGDGYPDLGVGCPWGAVPGLYITYSPVTTSMSLDYADVVLYGGAGSNMGHGSDLADVNGDGIADALVASYAASRTMGAAYVVYGPLTTDLDVTTDADFSVQGEEEYDYLGRVAEGGGDVDGDGVGDLLIAATQANIIGYHTGAVYLVHGGATGDISAADAQAKLIGETESAAAGNVMAMADVNGDGYDDIVAGAWGTQVDGAAHGAAYVSFGPVSGTRSLGEADVVVYGNAGTAFASGIASDDIDQDGQAELFVGAYWAEGEDGNSGNAYLYYALTAGSYGVSDADAVLMGVNEGDSAGQGVALGDIDGDSRGDLIVGASYESTGATRAGSIYVLYPELW